MGPFYSQQQSPSLAQTMKKQEEKSEMSWQVDAPQERDLADRGEQLPSPGYKPVFETKPIFFATVCLPVYVSCQHLMALLCTCLPASKF